MSKNRIKKFSVLLLSSCVSVFAAGLALFFAGDSSAENEFVYNAKGKRDPFIALVTPDGRILNLDKEEDNSKGLKLEGIMYDSRGVSYAIVNSKVVKVGDEVSGYQVLKIEKHKVIFIMDGQSTEVELKKEGL